MATIVLDPYETLGVSRDASVEIIKAAYRRIAKQTHPDLHGESEANTRRFREATDAYAILSNPAQRARFDRSGTFDQESLAAMREEIFAAVAYIRATATSAKAVARRAAVKGVLWLLAGILITALSYSAAASSAEGGSYVIMWGAMLFGGIQAIRGFAAYFRIEGKAREIEQELWAKLADA